MADSATIRDVAHLANVSVGTVSNYLNSTKTIAPATLERIERAIKKLEFVPNSAVRVVLGGRAQAIGLVVPDAPNPFFAEIARGVEDIAFEHGLVVVSCNTDGLGAREERYIRALSELRVAGMLITPVLQTDEHLRRFVSSGGAVVLMDEPPRTLDVSAVYVDDALGGRLAMDHLLDLGHRDVLFVGGVDNIRQVRDRFSGAQEALSARGLDPLSLRRLDSQGTSLSARAQVGDQIALMHDMPTAIFCANDLLALAIQGSLHRRGVSMPDEISIVGYDDIESAQLSSIPLTSVRQPQYELGRAAATILVNEYKHEGSATIEREQIRFEPTLIVRQSTTEPRSAG